VEYVQTVVFSAEAVEEEMSVDLRCVSRIRLGSCIVDSASQHGIAWCSGSNLYTASSSIDVTEIHLFMVFKSIRERRHRR